MADGVGEVQTVEVTQPEPNLTDIRRMLVDIQATVAICLVPVRLSPRPSRKIDSGDVSQTNGPE